MKQKKKKKRGKPDLNPEKRATVLVFKIAVTELHVLYTLK
jgi:hypothetical protein